jgi:predicted nucleic acid-binding protein
MEVLNGGPRGERLWRDYLQKRRVVTPAMAIAEVTSKIQRQQGWREADEFVKGARLRSRIHPMDDDVGALAGQLVKHLKARDRDASLADAIMLATARTLGLPLISNDPCFAGEPDVRCE